ncbi:hypothetical protein BLNAU_20715 [Blattamonas nauphoetae]|uniref:Uncharacterized protein n=1 Tax=Blattamonas nauphoetae TaxID=2049346 RepID=A0ABQ9WY25_9EUKA|nr:hypothetical protein BLNAU_20715 [Blattamonas nauphoetae]
MTFLRVLLLAIPWISADYLSTIHPQVDVSRDFEAFLEVLSNNPNRHVLSAVSTVVVPNGTYHGHDIHIHSQNVDISGLSSTISHRYSLHNLTEENESQHQTNEEYRSTKELSVMFDVWNSTCRLDNLRLFANTPDTAVSLIRSSTFVPSLIIRIVVSAASGERATIIVVFIADGIE